MLEQQPSDSKIIQEERSQQESEEDLAAQQQQQEEPETNFDFGRAKMDYFKQRAKEILSGDSEVEYAGTALQLATCFKSLKNAIRNPVVVHGGSEEKPHYLKMTFSTCRQAVNGDRFLEMSKLIGSNGSLLKDSSISKIPALMRAGKD